MITVDNALTELRNHHWQTVSDERTAWFLSRAPQWMALGDNAVLTEHLLPREGHPGGFTNHWQHRVPYGELPADLLERLPLATDFNASSSPNA